MNSPARDEREALRLRDLASALDAGLPLSTILPGSRVEAGIAVSLANGGELDLGSTERLMLEAAESAGTLPASLRLLADQREKRAALGREVRLQLRKPALTLLVAVLAAYATARIRNQGFTSLSLAILGILAGLVLVGYWIRRRILDPAYKGSQLPVVGPALQDAAEVPYLQSLLGLYGAGVKVAQAHARAADTCPLPFVRYRLRAANPLLEKGGSLAESLAASSAVCPETLQLLGSGEIAGELEDALSRALGRRRETLQRGLVQMARSFTYAVGMLVGAYAVYLVFSFYSNLYSGLLGR